MDLQSLIASSVYLNRQIESKKQLHWSNDGRVKNAFVALDVELAEMANTSEWFKVWKTHRGKHDPNKTPRETLLYEYVDAMDFYLLISNLKNWNHVILNSQDDLDKIKQFKKEDNLDKQYLALKRMLFDAYFDHSGDSFSHSWRLFLKFGLVDFDYTEQEIEQAFKDKNKINEDRQDQDY
ncbi:dUTPase [Lentilactobacillus buchneri]|uniref:dUTPase n=1 Tax=Lentilactobacillus buchneri TaxID=1581 RepID=UPI001290AF24|nr:dUTPase [Lentilactobacillus buchneri]MQM77667.1 2-deoxyuridine 5-triphosphate nucleotidohydrolase [Lentilactobacillus buchneri]MQM87680.1 2-deoxyuridine 5-triphosphate nucleotidohydrolase [Lentilactobacillus buchneri]MQN22193.1 2-deoxyuridine 5-triphosphate nucleotidohydrolase [Lentilactobacillus buchneri]